MKTKFIVSCCTVLFAVATTLVCITCLQNKTKEKSFFERNLDALTEEEIIVGPLCMECPNAACTSLGEVFKEYYPA